MIDWILENAVILWENVQMPPPKGQIALIICGIIMFFFICLARICEENNKR